MNVLDLFSGIGGFSLGLERLGMRTVAFCERDDYCRAVLRKHWPTVPCFEDVHAISSDGLDRLGRIDLICGGFPCQPFSQAGKQRAQGDDRHLWPQMRRVIALARPAWVLGENVAGIVALALDDVLTDLEGIGYAARPFVIPACAVDAQHRRDRVWIIARDADNQSQPTGAVNEQVAELCRAVTNTDRSGLEGRQRAVMSERGAEQPAGSSGPHPANAYSEPPRWSTEPRGQRCEWRPEPNVGRVANGVPRRMDRLKALGNAVVPQVVEEIGRAILAIESRP